MSGPTGQRDAPGLHSMAELVEEMEATDKAATVQAGLSSAAIRAGEEVRHLRRAAALTQQTLADRVGVPQSHISDIEAGKGLRGPTWDLMERIVAACGGRITIAYAHAAVGGFELEATAVFEEEPVRAYGRG